MARTTLVVLEDDLDGGTADETVTFSVDGIDYEIDLSAPNAEKMRAELDKFVGAARRTGGRAKRKKTASAAPPAAKSRQLTVAIREWAREQGLDVSDRGRIPAGIVEKYEAAHG